MNNLVPVAKRVSYRDEWLTPPEILRPLGRFDLDPCASVVRPWPTADQHYTVRDNGLSLPWSGRIWLNPPYGADAEAWLRKLAEHGNGMALIFARTETRPWLDLVWGKASALLFLHKRVRFCDTSGRPGTQPCAPSVLVAYGGGNAACLASCGLTGAFVTGWYTMRANNGTGLLRAMQESA